MKEPTDLPSAERWDEIAFLLNEALERPPDERAAFLDDACAEDPALRREVDAFLEAEAEAPAFLEGSATELLTIGDETFPSLSNDASTVASLPEGQRVGAYRLTHPIGRGGMSTVYCAERADGQFDRTVAVKVLRQAVEGDSDLRRRFRAERQILASLSHPYVAQVFDGGVTVNGRPYLVMELVEGRPITTYCDEEQLDVQARLALFDKVAEAVQHTHQNMVVHRDLKPSNILVTPEGTPKLLDFGIAKLLETGAGGEAFRTRTGALLMTPAYAAPEQVRRDDVTASTDVYALGVLLYELLAGCRPYDIEGRNPLDIARVVCEEMPSRPSVAARDRLQEEGERRAWLPEPGALRGDLDAIVMKALRKEPSRRYATAAALQEDLQHHRAGRPVAARTGTWSYRAGRFVRRYRWSMSAALAFVLLLAAYAATVTVQSQRIRQERDQAEATAAFLKNVLSISDPEKGEGGAVPARVLLREGAAHLDTSFTNQPALKADLKEVIGSAFRGYGLYQEALQLHREALALRRAENASSGSRAIADTRNNIGEVFYYLDRPDSARVQYRQSLKVRRRLLGDRHVDIAQSLNNLALLDVGREDYARASERLEEALSIFRENLPKNHWRIANVLNNLAVTYGRQGRLAEAERRYREALAMHLRVKGETHRDVARTQASLGRILTRQGNYAEAETTLREALQRARKATSKNLPVVAHTLFGLGKLHQQQGEFVEAERHYRQARAAYREALPEDHRRQLGALIGLGEALLAQERSGEALAYAREAVKLCEEALPPTHRRSIEARSLLGAVLTAEGRYEEAEAHLLDSRDTLERPRTPKEEQARRETRERLSKLYEAWGKPEEAARYREVLDVTG